MKLYNLLFALVLGAVSVATQGSTGAFPPQTFSQPIDHLHNDSQYAPHSNGFFNNQYWFNAEYYQPGGPVVLIPGGPMAGNASLLYLQDGIVAQLIQEHHGIGVVLEHRYYGDSFPVPNLSIENCRFLTTAQAFQDAVYFAQTIQFPGLENYNLTASNASWIVYGGTYAGAFSAFLRTLYPGVFWGSIGSSATTEPIYDFWQYYEPLTTLQLPCIPVLRKLTHMIDAIYFRNESAQVSQLQIAFGLGEVTYFNDFANALSYGISLYEKVIWDPAYSSDDNDFLSFCSNLSDHNAIYPTSVSQRASAESLLRAGGYNPSTMLVNRLLNYIGWNNVTQVQPCASSGLTQDQCFTTQNYTFYQQSDLSTWVWRSWAYQACTEWGFFVTGEVPSGHLPLISRTIDIDYKTIVCRDAFNITQNSIPSVINSYGGYNISYPRLGLIGGAEDPWRDATPFAYGYGAESRKSSTSEPFILIPHSITNWDAYGVPADEVTQDYPPLQIQLTQKTEQKFVAAWLMEYQAAQNASTN